MNKKKLDQLRRELEEARRSPHGRKAAFFEGYAKRLGRVFKSGTEPTWVRVRDPALSPPLSIPHHSKAMKSGTARSIIDAMLSDCDDWDAYLLLNDEEETND